MLVGSKEKFGVELSKNNSELKKFRVWINSLYIGNYEDESYFPIFRASLESILNLPVSDPKYLKKNDNYISEILRTDDFDRSLIHLGDNFDDFYVIVFTDGEKFRFYWKIVEEPFANYKEYPLTEQSALIERNEIQEVVDLLSKL